MSDAVVFTRIEIEAFRGFRARFSMDLDASVVIITGPNGTGKTSIFDAIQWLLIGKISHLESYRTRRNAEHIVNSYSPGPAIVQANIRLQNDEFLVRRSGTHRSSILEISGSDGSLVSGDEANDWMTTRFVGPTKMSLEAALMQTALLQQDDMRNVLQAKPRERYEYLSDMLGLHDLERFEEAVGDQVESAKKVWASAAADERARGQQRERLRQRSEAIVLQLRNLPAVAEVAAVFDGALARSPLVSIRFLAPFAPEELRLFSSEAARAAETLRELGRRRAEIEDQIPTLVIPSTEEIVASDSLVTESRQRLEAGRAALSSAQQRFDGLQREAESFERFVAAALPLLTNTCPVCERPIDPDDIREKLTNRSDLGARLEDARNELEREQSELSEAETDFSGALENLAKVRGARDAYQRLIEANAAVTREIRRLRESSSTFTTSDAEPAAIAQSLNELSEFAISLAAVLSGSALEGEREALRGEIAGLDAELEGSRDAVRSAAARENQLTGLLQSTKRARTAVTARRFSVLSPLLSDIFRRLDPHPSFKELEFDHTVYNARGETLPRVRDLVQDVEADPLLVFSTSQANIAALSFFLAMGYAAGRNAIPFTLLDDPLQSMDDVNVLGLADLCRHLRSRRQLIISTHETRFAELLKRKLAPRSSEQRTRVLAIHAWGRAGPEMEQSSVPPQLREQERMVVGGPSR